jgi:hypothetical protein
VKLLADGQGDAEMNVSHASSNHLQDIFYACGGAYAEVERVCMRAMELDPSVPAPYVALASAHASAGEDGKMMTLLTRAIDVNPRALRNCLDQESPGEDRPKGAPPKRVNLPEGIKGDAQVSRALVKVAMSRIATREDKEAVLAAEIAL